MKNKLFGLLLSVLMLSVLVLGLVSCSEEEETTQTTGESFRTLTMWVIWEGHEEGATDKDASYKLEREVEAAFNTVTKESYSTQISFKWFKDEATYKAALEEKYAALDAAAEEDKGNPPVDEAPPADGEETETGTEAETEQINNKEYPEVQENQLDLVLILDKEMLDTYVTSGRLTALDTLLTTDGKELKAELSTVIEAASGSWKCEQVDENGIPILDPEKKEPVVTTYKGSYAIPNLNTVGEYTYLLVNKDMATKYHTGKTEADYTSITDCLPLIYEVAKNEVGKVVPLMNEFDYYRAFFYTPYKGDSVFDSTNLSGKNGLISTTWSAVDTYGYANSKRLLNSLDNKDYVNYLALMNWCASQPAGTMYNDEAGKFAVGVIKGNYEDKVLWEQENYICVTLDKPRMTNEELFGGMWAISTYTADAGRALTIIEGLQTNNNLINTLVYGKKNLHYLVNEDGAVEKLQPYKMDPKYVGNLYRVLPDADLGQTPEWLAGRILQKNEWQRDIFAGFSYHDNLNKESADVLQAFSNKIFAELFAFESSDPNAGIEDYVTAFCNKAAELGNEETCAYWTAKDYIVKGVPTDAYSVWKNMVWDTAASSDGSFNKEPAKTHSLSGSVLHFYQQITGILEKNDDKSKAK